MNVADLEKFYGTRRAAAFAIQCSPQAVSKWDALGKIPTDYQIQWEIHSAGKLRADIPDAIRRRKAA